jgi:signal transduction histidine kinase
MRERVRSLGGTLEISSPLRGGTTMLVSAPLPVLRLVATPPTAGDGVAAVAQGGHSVA